MVCIYCGCDTQVINSRLQKRPNQVWRRRKCKSCAAIFTTIEGVESSRALSFQKAGHLQPFSRDILFISVYESLKHRNSATLDATALTSTVLSALHQLVDSSAIDRDILVTICGDTLERFDPVAATHYRAYHPS